jgi:hypothetical protein
MLDILTLFFDNRPYPSNTRWGHLKEKTKMEEFSMKRTTKILAAAAAAFVLAISVTACGDTPPAYKQGKGNSQVAPLFK